MAILFGSQNGQAFLIYLKRCFKKMKKKGCRLATFNLMWEHFCMYQKKEGYNF